MAESGDSSKLNNVFESLDFINFLQQKSTRSDSLGENKESSNRTNALDSADLINFLQQKTTRSDSLTESDDSSNRKNVLDSVDFINFLQQKSMKSSDSLTGLLGPGGSSMFKSKDSFGSSFLSKDWESKPSSNKPLHASGNGRTWKAAENLNIPTAIAAAVSAPASKDSKFTVQKSQDWIKLNTLGEYVDMPYSTNMFSATGSSKQQAKASLAIPSSFSVKAESKVVLAIQENPVPIIGAKTKKRKRAPRKKIVPVNKKYMTFTDDDVLMGRGGKSNHHKGNIRYRREIERLQEQYKETGDKDEKTSISEQLVTLIQSYGGNFLEKDEHGWYVIDDVIARRKASQALREDKDPEKRKAKRQRFLTKRAREEEARKKGIQKGG